MENASKALLIAGSILVAVLIIAILVKSFTSVSSFQKTKLSAEEQEKLVAFNEQYTKYLGQYVYGTEVRTLINKFKDDGKVKVLPENINPPDGVGQDTQYYKCTAVGYDNSNGRVNSITFKLIEMNATT